MSRKHKILVPVGCRSDSGLSAPVIRRLEKTDWVDEVIVAHLPVNDYRVSYHAINSVLDEFPDVDFFLATGDRVEMAAATVAAFHRELLIGHLFAGDLSTVTVTHDDMHRFAISVYADVHFCSTPTAAQRIRQLDDLMGRGNHAFVVGSTQLDDMEVDTSLVPDEDFVLVLYNPPTRREYNDETPDYYIRRELAQIVELLENTGHYRHKNKPMVLWNEPNPDAGRDKIKNWVSGTAWNYLEGLTRPQFLGLLKHCKAFIGNSSSLTYEAPFFLKKSQIIPIGGRNYGRDAVCMGIGASDKIVERIKYILGD